MLIKTGVFAVALAGVLGCSSSDFSSSMPTRSAKSNDAQRGHSDASDGAEDGGDVNGSSNPDVDADSGSPDAGGQDAGSDDSTGGTQVDGADAEVDGGDLGASDDAGKGDDLGSSDDAGKGGDLDIDDDTVTSRTEEQWVKLLPTAQSLINGKMQPGFHTQLKVVSHYSGGNGVRNDAASAAEACKRMGFLDGRATAASNWSAPYNETMWFFAAGKWQYAKSKARDRNHIDQLECKQTCTIKGTTKTCTPY